MVFDKIGRALGRGARSVGGEGLTVIKWPAHLNPQEYIAWRYPKDWIKWGSVVVVEQSQRAVFLRDGKILGVLGPGRYQLDTQNVPFLKGFAEGLYGETPFKATVIFVNVIQYEAKFGHKAFISRVGVELQFNGQYYFSVDENRIELFIAKLMGTAQQVTVDDVRQKLNVFMISKISEGFAEYAVEQMRQGRMFQTYEEFMALLQEFSEYVKASVARKIHEMYGIKIVDLAFVIDLSERDKRILQMSGFSPVAYAAMYERDWEGRKEVAESLSKGQPGASIAPIVAMPWMMYPPYPPPYPPQQQPPPPPPPPGRQPPPPGYPPGYPPPGYPQQPPPGQPYPPYPYPYPQQPGQQPPPGYPYPQQRGPQPVYQQPAGQQPAQQPPAPVPPPPSAPGVQQQPQRAAQRPRCPHCGLEVPVWAPVCPHCAQQIQWCPDGRPVKPGGKC